MSLFYADCICRVNWQIPPHSSWQNPLISGVEKLAISAVLSVGAGVDYGDESRNKTLEHLAEARETSFIWRNIGMPEDTPWGVRAAIRPSWCKIHGITYSATWQSGRATDFEDNRELLIELGLPALVAMA